MPYRFICEIGGWGAIRNPLDADDYLTIDDDELVVEDGELAAAIDKSFPALTLVEEPDEGDTDESDGEFDAESFLDRTPMDDVIEDIESGMVDAHLSELSAQAERKGVKEALAARSEAAPDET